MSRAFATEARETSIGGKRVVYALRRSRRRTIGFQVGDGGLVVAAPSWLPMRAVEAALQEKGRWIAARLAEARERRSRSDVAARDWRDGGSLRFLGGTLRLSLGDGADVPGLRRPAPLAGAGAAAAPPLRAGPGDGDVGTLHLPVPADAPPAVVRKAAERWLRARAREVFAARVARFAERLGVRVTRLGLSSARTRWGSASAAGAIRLHWRLVQLPPALVDYVVVHELAHLREMNHSPRFWAIVESVLPDHRERRRALREAALALA